jgi:hypothetical protein
MNPPGIQSTDGPSDDARSGESLSIPRAATLRRRHREALIASLLILLAAPLLQVLPDQRVALGAAANLKLPPLCPSNAIFGVRCPGCGLTRSFVHLAHADLPASLHDHRLGWLVALIVLLQIPYRAWALLGPTPLPLGRRFPAAIGLALLAALITNWLAEQLH